jgi:diguanylate cyclase (GGDEF)-like protein/hemerythrin-like metal-binding protein/PAS domain S-box-containing protein
MEHGLGQSTEPESIQQNRSDERLLQSEINYRHLAEQFEAIFDHLPALVFYKDKENRFIRVNKYVAEAYKKTKNELEGVSLFDLYPEEEARRYFLDDLAVIESGKETLNIEEPWQTEDGPRWVSTSKIPFVDAKGEIQGVIGISMDITERKRADNLIQELIHRLELERDQARKSALLDGLTGIANRKGFDYTLEREYLRLQRSGASMSLIMIDIDHFKKFNDRYGHLAGDVCLRKVATALQDTLGRTPDYLARFGGEEFVVILPDTISAGALVVAERLRKAVEALAIPNEDSETSSWVTISLGVATIRPKRHDAMDHIIQLADSALYRAKDVGRNRVEVAGIEDVPDGDQSKDQGSFLRLVWDDTLACGNEVIDAQHRKLFELANTLIADLTKARAGQAYRPDFRALVDHIAGHFRDEEEILSSLAYPLLDDHRRLHASLVARASGMMASYEHDELEMKELLGFLVGEVVSGHLLQEDRKFFPLMISSGD